MRIDEDDDFELTVPIRVPSQLPGWFMARADGTCAQCRAPIYVKEWARMTDDGILCRPCAEDNE